MIDFLFNLALGACLGAAVQVFWPDSFVSGALTRMQDFMRSRKT